jgi:hypothetical protein
MSYSRVEILEHAKRIGKSRATLRRWISQGCNLRDPKSVGEWVTWNEIRKTNVQRSRERRAKEQKAPAAGQSVRPGVHPAPVGTSEPAGNGEVPPAGQKGAQHALARLEAQEAESYRRLQQALGRGDPVEIENTQQFWVRCVESLRKLDLSIELARRETEQQISLKVAQDAITAATEWMRVAVTTFLSSETISLMGIKDPGEFRSYFGQRFKGNLDLVIKSADKTCSALPDWAKTAIATAWNVRIDP